MLSNYPLYTQAEFKVQNKLIRTESFSQSKYSQFSVSNINTESTWILLRLQYANNTLFSSS